MSAAIAERTQESREFTQFVYKRLFRHRANDWGDLSEDDKARNDEALKNGDRIHSSFDIPEDLQICDQTKLWIITEGDRSMTTVLFPSDY